MFGDRPKHRFCPQNSRNKKRISRDLSPNNKHINKLYNNKAEGYRKERISHSSRERKRSRHRYEFEDEDHGSHRNSKVKSVQASVKKKSNSKLRKLIASDVSSLAITSLSDWTRQDQPKISKSEYLNDKKELKTDFKDRRRKKDLSELLEKDEGLRKSNEIRRHKRKSRRSQNRSRNAVAFKNEENNSDRKNSERKKSFKKMSEIITGHGELRQRAESRRSLADRKERNDKKKSKENSIYSRRYANGLIVPSNTQAFLNVRWAEAEVVQDHPHSRKQSNYKSKTGKSTSFEVALKVGAKCSEKDSNSVFEAKTKNLKMKEKDGKDRERHQSEKSKTKMDTKKSQKIGPKSDPKKKESPKTSSEKIIEECISSEDEIAENISLDKMSMSVDDSKRMMEVELKTDLKKENPLKKNNETDLQVSERKLSKDENVKVTSVAAKSSRVGLFSGGISSLAEVMAKELMTSALKDIGLKCTGTKLNVASIGKLKMKSPQNLEKLESTSGSRDNKVNTSSNAFSVENREAENGEVKFSEGFKYMDSKKFKTQFISLDQKSTSRHENELKPGLKINPANEKQLLFSKNKTKNSIVFSADKLPFQLTSNLKPSIKIEEVAVMHEAFTNKSSNLSSNKTVGSFRDAQGSPKPHNHHNHDDDHHDHHDHNHHDNDHIWRPLCKSEKHLNGSIKSSLKKMNSCENKNKNNRVVRFKLHESPTPL